MQQSLLFLRVRATEFCRAGCAKIQYPPVTDNAIQFGTSGWRAIIADEFTFDNVRLASAAIAGHLLSHNTKPAVIIGHDTRFFSEEFARTAGQVMRAHGVKVLLCDGPTPTPVIAYEIIRRKTDGAINFTASHNPAQYQGLKFADRKGDRKSVV